MDMATFVQPVWYTQRAEAAALTQLQQQAAQAASAPKIDPGPDCGLQCGVCTHYDTCDPDNHFPELPELTPELEEAWESWELHAQEHPEGLSELDLERLRAESDAAMLRRPSELDGFFAAVFGAPINVATLGK
jgi:hypothetical protein